MVLLGTPSGRTFNDTGIIIGNHESSQSSYGWDGAISQIIYFDRTLRAPEKRHSITG